MEDCEETIFEKGETIETNEIKEEPPANKKEENQIKKDEKDLHIKSIVDIKKGYFCSQCSSLIKILSINEENTNIEFQCLNKNNPHQESINIEEYLNIRNRNKNKIDDNGDTCTEHKEKFSSYCFECNKQLCIKCQKNGIHIRHKKVNLIEIEPSQEELTIFKEIIDYYSKQIQNLRKSYINNDFEFLEKFNRRKYLELVEIDKREKFELEKLEKKYFNDLNLMKEKYESDIKSLKREYEKYKHNIRNVYFKIKEDNLKNLKNINDLNEIIYNTYNENKNNFFYAININNMILNYYQNNEYIENNIIKNILKKDCDEVIDSIKRKIEPFGMIQPKREPKVKINFKIGKRNKICQIRNINNKNESNIFLLKRAEKENNNKSFNKVSKLNTNKDLLPLLNHIFFRNEEKALINKEKIDENIKDLLKNKYNNYKKENKENVLIEYFDNYVKNNLLKFFKEEKFLEQNVDIIKYNIENILECFKSNKYKYDIYFIFTKTNIGKEISMPERINTNPNIIFKIEKNNSNLESKKSKDLFKLFNNIFFKNWEQTSINGDKINESQKDKLSNIFFKYKKENKEIDLINYFDTFVRSNVLCIFLRKDVNERIIENIKYNIETILICFGLNRYYYKEYYYPEIYENTPIRNRQNSWEAARKFRKTFNIDESIIKDEELIKRLVENDDDVNKVFQQIFG